MLPDFDAILHQAESHYLQDPEILVFRRDVIALKERLEAYKGIRNEELSIFQPIADPLLEACSDAHAEDVERALRHWIAILRYAAMAMLLGNPAFLNHRILEWLTDIVAAHKLHDIESKLYELMTQQMNAILPESYMACIQPYLEQAKQALIASPVESAESLSAASAYQN